MAYYETEGDNGQYPELPVSDQVYQPLPAGGSGITKEQAFEQFKQAYAAQGVELGPQELNDFEMNWRKSAEASVYGGVGLNNAQPWEELLGEVTGYAGRRFTPNDGPAQGYDDGGGGGGYSGGGYASAGPQYNWEAAPQFNAPTFDAPDPFRAPTAEEAANEPGYQFAVDQGVGALESSAAAKGSLRTGGTLKDLIAYGQKLAGQQYGNVYDRSLNTYNTNFGAKKDVFDRTYQGARDEYAPKLTEWDRRMTGMQRSADLGFQRGWDEYVFGVDDDFRRDRSASDDAYRQDDLDYRYYEAGSR